MCLEDILISRQVETRIVSVVATAGATVSILGADPARLAITMLADTADPYYAIPAIQGTGGPGLPVIPAGGALEITYRDHGQAVVAPWSITAGANNVATSWLVTRQIHPFQRE